MRKINWTAAFGPRSAAWKPLFWCNS